MSRFLGRMSENDKKGDKDEKKEKNAETTEQRRSRRAAAPTTSSSTSNNEPEVKSKEKKSTSAVSLSVYYSKTYLVHYFQFSEKHKTNFKFLKDY